MSVVVVGNQSHVKRLFECPECGPQHLMHFDASILEERAFEGVVFEVVRVDAVRFEIRGRKQDERYLDTFNMPRFLKDARTILEDEAEDLMHLICPKCGETVE